VLRHACGYKIANDGVDTRGLQHYLGHRNIAHTVRYTALVPDRFRRFWRTDGLSVYFLPSSAIVRVLPTSSPARRRADRNQCP
jgi:hypothetical protein